MNLRWLMALAFAGTCGAVPSGQAAELLRLEEAVTRSLESNPILAAELAEVRAAESRAEHAALPTQFVVGGELENFGGTGAVGGARYAETTLRLSRVIELGGKREARRALGTAEVLRQRNLADSAKLEIASRTTARYVAVAAAQQQLEFARERVKLAEQTRAEVDRWVEAARNPASDLRAAEIAVAEAELAVEDAEYELASARMTLAASWGAIEPDFTAVTGTLHELPPVEPFEVLAARLPMTPTQRDALLQADAIAARRRVAITSARPDIDVSIGVRRLEALDDQGLVMSVSVPLGSRPRANLAIAEADAQLAAVQLRREAQRAESRQALFALYQEMRHARTEHDALLGQMVPKAEQAYALTRRGFEAGRFSFVTLTQAQRTLFELRERSVDAAARYHTRLVEVERLTALPSELSP